MTNINAKYESRLDDLRKKYTVTVTDTYTDDDGFPIARKGFLKLDGVNVASYEQDPWGGKDVIVELNKVLWTNFDNECRSMPDYVYAEEIRQHFVPQCDREFILAELFTGG